MHPILSDEQVAFQQAFRRLFADNYPPEAARQFQQESTGTDRVWRALAGVEGFTIGVPESLGGSDGTLVEVAVGLMEAGRALCPSRYRTTVVFALATAGAKSGEEWVSRIHEGEATAAIAAPSLAGGGHIRVQAQSAGLRLRGEVGLVPGARASDVFLVIADDATGPPRERAFVVPASDVNVTPRDTWSGDNADLDLDIVVNEESEFDLADAGGLSRIRLIDEVLQCAEMVGGAEAVLERTTRYVVERHQFGRPIGSFQAVQHDIADMHMSVDAARLATYFAAWRIDEGISAQAQIVAALSLASAAFKQATLTAHQLHGGLGFSRDSDLFLWSERAKALELGGALPEPRLRELADLLVGLDRLPTIWDCTDADPASGNQQAVDTSRRRPRSVT